MKQSQRTAGPGFAGPSQILRDVLRQFRQHPMLLAAVYVPGFLIVLLVWIIGGRPDGKITVADLVRDTAQVAELPFYTGALSNLGIVFWSATGGICLLTAAVLKRRRPKTSVLRRFFLFAGILTAMLAVDDMFMLHEEVFPKYLFPKKNRFHMKEGIFFIAYAGVTAAFLWRCRDFILRKTDFGFLVLAFGFLGLSIAADKIGIKFMVPNKQARFLIEDGAKFLGILGWTLYFTRTAVQSLTSTET